MQERLGSTLVAPARPLPYGHVLATSLLPAAARARATARRTSGSLGSSERTSGPGSAPRSFGFLIRMRFMSSPEPVANAVPSAAKAQPVTLSETLEGKPLLEASTHGLSRR